MIFVLMDNMDGSAPPASVNEIEKRWERIRMLILKKGLGQPA